MAGLCPNGHATTEGAKFCPVCGVRVAPLSKEDVPGEDTPPKARQPVPMAGHSIWASLASRWRGFGWKAKTAVIATAVVVGLGLLGSVMGESDTTLSSKAGKPATTTTTSPKPTKPKPQKPNGYVDLLLPGMTPQKAARPVCSKYKATISTWSSVADQRLASSSGATADAYAASDYEGDVGWLNQSHEQNFDKAVYNISRARLRVVTRRGLTPEMVTRFSNDAVWLCKLSKDSERTSDKPYSLDSRAERISSLASSVPWYPRDFNHWSDNLAYRWVDNPNCDYFRCWQMYVVTASGCPDGLYADMNIEVGGTVVDFSNDSLGSLSPGASALLTFTDTSDYDRVIGSLTELNCY